MVVAAPVYVALLHYPVLNRRGDTITTAVTTIDIPDIARSARTFGARNLFLVTPIAEQQRMIGEILEHWTSDSMKEYHPPRVEAVSIVRMASSFGDVRRQVAGECGGEEPEVILTTARQREDAESYESLARELGDPARSRPAILVVGTGWGVAEEFSKEIHRVLAPIHGPGGEEGYNHLSVRAAAAIILDRLFGR